MKKKKIFRHMKVQEGKNRDILRSQGIEEKKMST
jgi:hypothetical protein